LRVIICWDGWIGGSNPPPAPIFPNLEAVKMVGETAPSSPLKLLRHTQGRSVWGDEKGGTKRRGNGPA